jgi:hypothetical protein
MKFVNKNSSFHNTYTLFMNQKNWSVLSYFFGVVIKLEKCWFLIKANVYIFIYLFFEQKKNESSV